MDKLDRFVSIIFWTVIIVLCIAEFIWMLYIKEPFAASMFIFFAVTAIALLVHLFKEQ